MGYILHFINMDQSTWLIVSSIGAVVIGILGWLLRNLYSIQDDKIDTMEEELKKIKENYLDRFEKMNNHVTKSKEEIIDKLHALELSNSARVAAQLIETTAAAVASALKQTK